MMSDYHRKLAAALKNERLDKLIASIDAAETERRRLRRMTEKTKGYWIAVLTVLFAVAALAFLGATVAHAHGFLALVLAVGICVALYFMSLL